MNNVITSITEDWRFSDGYWDPIPLARLTTVREALAEDDRVTCPVDIPHWPTYEWVAHRTWRYETHFNHPDTFDERWYLEMDGLCGACEVSVNDIPVYTGHDAAIRVDITQAIRDKDNQLVVVFPPVGHLVGGYVPEIGISGAVRISSGNYLTIEQCTFTPQNDGRVRTHLCVCAYVSGKYRYTYRVSNEAGDSLEQLEGTEVLRPIRTALTHELRIPASCAGHSVDATLIIERGGVFCAQIRETFHVPHAHAPAQRGVLDVPTCALGDMARLGANAVMLSHPTANARLLCAEHGITPIVATSVWRAPEALQRPERLTALAGGEPYWPNRGYVWRMTDSPFPSESLFHAKFGTSLPETGSEAARLTRFMQARAAGLAAARARLHDMPFFLNDAWDAAPRLASVALYDDDGVPRPAFGALALAWRARHACVLLNGGRESLLPGQSTKLPIYYMTDAHAPDPVTVSATAYQMDGTAVERFCFPAIGGSSEHSGELTVRTPDAETAILVRLQVSADDGTTFRTDEVIFVTTHSAPYAPLRALPRTKLRMANGQIANVGSAIAVDVNVPGLPLVTLLPGESIPCAGVLPETIECVTAEME